MELGCDSGFHDRLKHILSSEKSSTAFARRAGMSQSGFSRIEKGGEPGLQSLLAIARAADVSVNWLATGEGPMRRDQAPSDPPPAEAPTPVVPAGAAAAPASLDGALLGLCLEGLKGVYKDVGARIDDRSAGKLAARLYDDVMAAAEGEPDQETARRAALRVALQHLRRDLLRHDESGKHSA